MPLTIHSSHRHNPCAPDDELRAFLEYWFPHTASAPECRQMCSATGGQAIRRTRVRSGESRAQARRSAFPTSSGVPSISGDFGPQRGRRLAAARICSSLPQDSARPARPAGSCWRQGVRGANAAHGAAAGAFESAASLRLPRAARGGLCHAASAAAIAGNDRPTANPLQSCARRRPMASGCRGAAHPS